MECCRSYRARGMVVNILDIAGLPVRTLDIQTHVNYRTLATEKILRMYNYDYEPSRPY